MMTSFEGFDTLASSNLPRPEQLAQGVITKINDKKDSFGKIPWQIYGHAKTKSVASNSFWRNLQIM